MRNDYKAAMRGLYIHIPFCQTRCHYCNFVTTAEHSPGLRKRFLDAVSAEIKHACNCHGRPARNAGRGSPALAERLSFDTLYLGGGTPSSLSIPELRRLVEGVHSAFEFKDGYEFTCELNPGDGDETKLKTLRGIGVNRVSLGCQSFRDAILKKLGRRHTVQDIEETVSKIQRAGIINISLDLMLRLPGQTVEDFCDSVRRCIELEASQVSLYDLEVHEGTPFGQFLKEGKLDLPGEEDHARMYESAIEMLTSADRHEKPGEPRPSKDLGRAGYEHYEISNFTKPGLASRHNLIYWHNQEYLGLGPGAFTYLNGTRSQFALDLARYLEKCDATDWQNDVEDRLSEEEKETETLVTGLRLCEGIVPGSFPKIHPALKGRLETLCAEGLMERSGENVRLTVRGKFLSEDVFGFLLEKIPSRHGFEKENPDFCRTQNKRPGL